MAHLVVTHEDGSVQSVDFGAAALVSVAWDRPVGDGGSVPESLRFQITDAATIEVAEKAPEPDAEPKRAKSTKKAGK